MNNDILNKYFSGKASSAETEDILNWIEESKENAAIFASKKSDWVFDHLPGVKASDDVYNEFRRRRKTISPKEILIRVAAILLIPISILSVIQFVSNSGTNKDEEIQIVKHRNIPKQDMAEVTYTINSGVKGHVLLPDGSMVWLNSCSNLKCPAQFDSTYRIVELTGEGYFKIKPNHEWPLYVKTSKGITVKVTGTEFNLSSYNDDSELKLTLISGAVTLIRESDKKVFNVKKLEEIVIPDNDNMLGKKSVANLHLNTAWKDGYLTFDNTPMDDVIKKMERWYGVSIAVNNPTIHGFFITANFKSESITQVLELFGITSNIGYSIKNNKVALFLK